MTSRFLTLAALLALFYVAACSAKPPAEMAPRLVTLASFEGEIDPNAGTFVVRSTSPAGTSAGPSAALAIPTGPGTLTIANAGTPAPNVDGTGGCSGRKVLSAPVRITLGYPNPGFAGALYAEILTLSGTGAESCDSATPPPGSGLATDKGLWSYGTVRPGATTSDQTWQFKWTAGQKTTFTGRVVGVPGTTIDVSAAKPACFLRWNTSMAYTRAVASGADRIAYAVRDSTNIALLDLDGASQGSLVAPQAVNTLASYTGSTEADDILWFTTDGYVGVVYRGLVYSTPAGGTGSTDVTVDPTATNRAWFFSSDAAWFRSATFNTSTHDFALGSTVALPNTPTGLALGPAISPATGTWVYVASYLSLGNWIKAWDLSGVPKATVNWGASECYGPSALMFGPDGKLWYSQSSTGTPAHQWCTFDPATGAFQRFPVPTDSAAGASLGVAPATTGSGSAVWGLVLDPNDAIGGDQALQLTAGATAGQRTMTAFAVTLPEHGAWGCSGTQQSASIASSPAASGHPAYLWWTGYQSIYRMQP